MKTLKMKKLNDQALKFIDTYQKNKDSNNKKCRFIPTCSAYAKEAYSKFNFLKASYLTTKRLLKCNPLTKMGTYDPLPRDIANEDLIDAIQNKKEQ